MYTDMNINIDLFSSWEKKCFSGKLLVQDNSRKFNTFWHRKPLAECIWYTHITVYIFPLFA